MGKRKLLLAGAGVLIAALLVTLVYAAIVYRYDMAGSVTVQSYGITVYEIDGVTEVTSIDFGILDIGETSSYNVIMKNTGDYTIRPAFETNLNATWGTIECVSDVLFEQPLAKDQTRPVTVKLTILDEAQQGVLSFNMTFIAEEF